MEMQQIEIKLPDQFVEYVNKKIEKGKKGRKHLLSHLGSTERALELLRDVLLNKMPVRDLEKKYNVGYYQIYRFIKEIEPFKKQIIDYLNVAEETISNFREIHIIKEWENKIRRSGHLSMLKMIGILENICTGVYIKTFKIHPNKLNLETAQKYVDLYIKTFNVKRIPRHQRQALRHFLMVAKNVHIPRGFGSLYGLSGEKENFGAYKFIRLTDQQIAKIREYFMKNNDLEALTFFDWSLESLGRMKAVALTKMNFVQDGEIVTTSLYESKTEKSFQKFLLLNIPHAKETWEEIQKLGKRS